MRTLSITINISEHEKKLLKERAKRNLFTIKEQIEDIIRRSCRSQKSRSKSQSREPKIDDKLVNIFSKPRKSKKKKK